MNNAWKIILLAAPALIFASALSSQANTIGGRLTFMHLSSNDCLVTVRLNVNNAGNDASLPAIEKGIDLSYPGCEQDANLKEILRKAMADDQPMPLVQWDSKSQRYFELTSHAGDPTADSEPEENLNRLEYLQSEISPIFWYKGGKNFVLSPMIPLNTKVVKIVPDFDVDESISKKSMCLLFTESSAGDRRALIVNTEQCENDRLAHLVGQQIEYSLADLSLVRLRPLLVELEKLNEPKKKRFFFNFLETENLPWLQNP